MLHWALYNVKYTSVKINTIFYRTHRKNSPDFSVLWQGGTFLIEKLPKLLFGIHLSNTHCINNDAVWSFSIHQTECPKTNQVLVTLSQMQCGILHVFKIQQVLSKSEKSSLPNVKERFTRCFDLSAGLFMNMFLNTQFYKCIMYTRVLSTPTSIQKFFIVYDGETYCWYSFMKLWITTMFMIQLHFTTSLSSSLRETFC